MTNVNYEDRAILFVDILGWTEELKRKSADEIYRILSPFIQLGNEHNEQRREEIQQGVAEDNGLSLNPLHMSIQVSFFSDCFVCSMPSEFASRLCNITSHIIRDLVKSKFCCKFPFIQSIEPAL